MKKTLITAMLLATTHSLWAEDLSQVYREAVEFDAQLGAAKATLEAQKEAKPLALSTLLPAVGVSGDLNYRNQEVHSSPAGSYDDDYSTSGLVVDVVQPLYRRDRLVRLEQSDWVIEQAVSEYRAVEQDLMIRTAQAYFDVLGAQDDLQFSEAEKKAIERQLDQAKQRFEVGLIAITGVHETQARYDQANTDVIVAMNELDAAWESLREIIGMKPENLSVLKSEIPLLPPNPASLDEWSVMGLENSPSIKAASDATQIAQKEIDVQYSGHYPTLDAYGNYGLSRSSSDFGSDVNSGNIGLLLNVPLYTGGGVSAATRQARAELIAAQERLDQARREVDRQVRNAYRTVHASISAVRSLQAGTVSAESALEATTAGFDVGTRTLVDVLNEQSDLFQAKRDYARARYVYVLAGLQLKRAAGVLTADDLNEVNNWLEQPMAAAN